MFNSVDADLDLPSLETSILSFWQEENIFQKVLDKDSPQGEFVFYEGPPTANGKPGIHHVSARAIKDLYPRYKTMCGFRSKRRGGWDTHGLPVEVQIEKEIGSKSKQDIEKFGVDKFNTLCRESVFRYVQDWNKLTERIGFWLDLDNAYITYRNEYIETCWWILKSFWERDLLFEDYKTTMHCPRCNTSLADHEVSQGMQDEVDDPSVWPKFKVNKKKLTDTSLNNELSDKYEIFFVAWTTTPWTLGANTALAIRGDVDYGYFKLESSDKNELLIVAVERAQDVFGDRYYTLISTTKGANLVGTKYEPILTGLIPSSENLDNAFNVISEPTVSTTDGSGVVHIAPAYGDLEIGRRHNLPTAFSVDANGEVYSEVRLLDSLDSIGPYSGLFFKEADSVITQDLLERNKLYKAERTLHAYPFCWRCDSPLMFFAKNSWYIKTTSLKDQLLEQNNSINWIPTHVKEGRFGNWLENNIDWAISRERYWGTPLPIWVSEDGKDKICIGSIKELEEISGQKLSHLDLHRPFIDDVTFSLKGKHYHRLPLTVDVWFDSGAMPYAQLHYPFENEEALENNFPADFIAEGMDQTRGWFYSLHALAVLLTDRGDTKSGRLPGALSQQFSKTSAFKNCIVLGLVRDSQGKKMSKSRGNTVDPWIVLDQQGADPLRWYLYTSSPAEKDKNFDIQYVIDVLKDFLMTLWNSYSFFVLYANLDKPDLKQNISFSDRPLIDKWFLSKLNNLIKVVTGALDEYDATTASRAIEDFVIKDLSNWYIRRNRRRFWKSDRDLDKSSAYLTLYEVLVTVCKLCAPMIPFTSEAIYKNLVNSIDSEQPNSVHLSHWPKFDDSLIDELLIYKVDLLRKVIEQGRSARAKSGIKIRQPLSEILIRLTSHDEIEALTSMQNQIKDELNVQSVRFLELDADFIEYKLRPNLPVLGKRLGKLVPEFVSALKRIEAKNVVQNIQSNSSTSIEVGGKLIDFPPNSFLVDICSPEGYESVENGGYLVAFNTNLTPELLREGKVREVLRHIQDSRKNAGFDISDRILLGIKASKRTIEDLSSYEDFIAAESLATEISFDPLEVVDYSASFVIEGEEIVLFLYKNSQ